MTRSICKKKFGIKQNFIKFAFVITLQIYQNSKELQKIFKKLYKSLHEILIRFWQNFHKNRRFKMHAEVIRRWKEERQKVENTYLSASALMTRLAAEVGTTQQTVRNILIRAGLYQKKNND